MFANKHDAYRVYLTYASLWSMALTLAFAVAMIYLVQDMGLDPLQMILVGTALELSAFIFEVPTGVVADTYSRRLSVITGLFIMGGSFFIFVIPSFPVILFSQVVLGLGWTFVSGAETAWITDEIGESKAGNAFIRRSQLTRLTDVFGVIIAIGLAMIDLRIPIALGGALLIFTGFYLIAFMPETGFIGASGEAHEGGLSAMLNTTREGARVIRGRPVLITLMLIIFLWGAFSESYDRLWTLHILENFSLPKLGELDIIVWFGIINLAALPLYIGVSEWVRRRVDKTDQIMIARVLMVANSLMIASLLVFALAGNFFIAVLGMWVANAMRGITMPLRDTWINQGLNPRVRATVLSMSSQMDAVGQIAGGPAIGLIGRQFGVRVALSLGSLILLPVLALYGRTIRQNGQLNAVPPEALPQAVE